MENTGIPPQIPSQWTPSAVGKGAAKGSLPKVPGAPHFTGGPVGKAVVGTSKAAESTILHGFSEPDIREAISLLPGNPEPLVKMWQAHAAHQLSGKNSLILTLLVQTVPLNEFGAFLARVGVTINGGMMNQTQVLEQGPKLVSLKDYIGNKEIKAGGTGVDSFWEKHVTSVSQQKPPTVSLGAPPVANKVAQAASGSSVLPLLKAPPQPPAKPAIAVAKPAAGKAQVKPTAGKLGDELSNIMSPSTKKSPLMMIGHYRNSLPVVLNMVQALKKYGETGDMDATFVITQAGGMGATPQPNTVRETFRQALDEKEHGGFQQTLESIRAKKVREEMLTEVEVGVLKTGDEIVKFLSAEVAASPLAKKAPPIAPTKVSAAPHEPATSVQVKPPVSQGQQQTTVTDAAIAQAKLQIAQAANRDFLKPAAQKRGFLESLAYQSPEKIQQKGGVLLTQNYGETGDQFIGIAAMPDPDEPKGFRLVLCPGGGYGSFTKQQLEGYLEEALKTIVEKKITITSFEKNIGRHPTITGLAEWTQGVFDAAKSAAP